jgi:uncharacterized coiled-coil protein SlyX
MTAPNFKVLVNALRLGQPPDVASIRAVVEQLLAQQEEIAELRRQLSLLQNRMAALTQVAEPDRGSRPPPAHHSAPPPAPAQGRVRAPTGAARGYAPGAAPPAAGYLEALPPSSARPPAGNSRGLPSIADDREGEGEFDEYNSTVVISRSAVDELEEVAAPFPIAPAGGGRYAPEIPGAPWARQAAEPAPAVHEIYDTHTSETPIARLPDGPPPSSERMGRERGMAGQRTGSTPPPYHGDPNQGPPRIPDDLLEEDPNLEGTLRRRDRG